MTRLLVQQRAAVLLEDVGFEPVLMMSLKVTQVFLTKQKMGSTHGIPKETEAVSQLSKRAQKQQGIWLCPILGKIKTYLLQIALIYI